MEGGKIGRSHNRPEQSDIMHIQSQHALLHEVIDASLSGLLAY